ncbi:MAG: hypothetical protein OEV42_10275 [Deltaproteobacteria bacterium]|nr:hypothetical protein [Deltaproteobacteria bacterium]
MPCEDSAAEISITIDKDEKIRSYEYEKISCGKNVGPGESYRSFCIGKIIDHLSEVTFEAAKKACPFEKREEEFLLYLEWKAVREALREYLGKERGPDSKRYKMAEIIAEKDCTILKMIILEPDNMPEIIPCGEQTLN